MNKNKIYDRGEHPPKIFSDYMGFNKDKRYTFLRMGMVELVDYDRYRVKISWVQGAGTPDWVPISFAYSGPGGQMGMIPEVGALGIFGFYSEGMGKSSTAKPFLLSYLPGNLAQALEYNVLKRTPDQIANEDDNLIPYRFHNLRAGDMIMSSPKGGEVFVNKDISLTDELEDTLLLRSNDQSIISTSLNNFVFADGVSVSMGSVIRNNITLVDDTGKKLNPLAAPLNFPDGRENIYITPFGKSIEYDSPLFTEYRVDVDETGDGLLDENSINSENKCSDRDPLVTLALGNYVGANETNMDQYGLLFKPTLFRNIDDTEGSFSLSGCRQDGGIDEPGIRGLAYALHFHKSTAFLGIDKEGHYYMNLPATTASSVGAGRSMSIRALGNLKEVWGAASEDANSWDLAVKGGIRWKVGAHNAIRKERSIDIRAEKGMYLEINGVDEDGYAKSQLLIGDTVESVVGAREVVAQSDYLTVKGLRTETVLGSSTSHVDGDYSSTVNGVFTEIVLKEKQARLGKRSTTITTGDDELTVLKGDIAESITLFGNKKTSIIGPGGISESITAGNRETSIAAGNYSVDVKAGNISLKTLVGTARLESSLTATLQSTISAQVVAPFVSLGSSTGPKGGVVTAFSHLDYVTGVPLRSSFTVKAGL